MNAARRKGSAIATVKKCPGLIGRLATALPLCVAAVNKHSNTLTAETLRTQRCRREFKLGPNPGFVL